jgi:AraC-like DNA-binding protein
VRVGVFRCPPEHPNFEREGEIVGYDFVFPRAAVWIHPAGARPFVADPATVTLYNFGQEYRRRPLGPRGDRSDWFSVDQEMAVEAANEFERVPPSAARPWRFSHAPADPPLYARQRLLVERLLRGETVDELELEETALSLLAAVLARAYGSAAPDPPRSQERLVRRTRALLAERFGEPLSLSDIAAAVGASPFHLCRAFRRATGVPLHAFRKRLRIHSALEDVLREGSDLAAVALDAGFSSHSHFTAAFRAALGRTPSALRRRSPGALGYRKHEGPGMTPRA